MKKTRTANLHHLYHEPLPENLKLTPKVEVDNVHQRQTTDVYEHALTITAWQQIYDQLHPGKFHGEFTEILLDDIQVFREYTGLALRQSCLVWPNSFWFGIPATRGEQGFIGSQCLGSAEIATRPGGTEFELSTPDDYTILGVVLSEDVITRQANFLHNPDRVLHMLRSQSALEVKEQHKAALFVTMFEVEVFVAPLFVTRINVFAKWQAQVTGGAVPVNGVFFKTIERG